MLDQCNRCGRNAVSEHEFTEEGFLLWGKRKYCPSCHATYQNRFTGAAALIALVFAISGWVWSVYTNLGFLEFRPAGWAALIICQWLTLLPHELGHAFAAKSLGFQNIRILIGSGRPLFACRMLGFDWLFNWIPFGGITVPTTVQTRDGLRWRYLLVVAAGPAVNLVIVLGAWAFGGSEVWSFLPRSWMGILLWANVIVIVENLFPQAIQTPIGPLQNDGLLLWNTLFKWRQKPRFRPEPIPRWEIAISQLLKGVIVLTLTLAILSLLAITVFIHSDTPKLPNFGFRILLTLFGVFLMFLLGYYIWKIVNQPVARARKQMLGDSVLVRGKHELLRRSGAFAYSREWEMIQSAIVRGNLADAVKLTEIVLARHPDNPLLLSAKSWQQSQEDKHADAEQTMDRILADSPPEESAAIAVALASKLRCIVAQGKYGNAEKLCIEFLASTSGIEERIYMADTVACLSLSENLPGLLGCAERLTRKALELAPETLTLKGTLGGILTEQGRFAEAEPLLRDCYDRSHTLIDKGISSFYLGVIESKCGHKKTARKMLKKAMVLHSDAWLVLKAKKLLKDLDNPALD